MPDSTSHKRPSHTITRHPRVRTGCRTCRQRHVKCDEEKPICGNCRKKSRPCGFDDGVSDRAGRHGAKKRPAPINQGRLSVPNASDWDTYSHVGEYSTVDESRTTTSSPLFDHDGAQLVEGRAAVPDALGRAPQRLAIHSGPDRSGLACGLGNHGSRRESPHGEFRQYGHSPDSLRDHPIAGSTPRLPQGWPSASLESVLCRARLSRPRRSPTDSKLTRGDFGRSPSSNTSYSPSHHTPVAPLSASPALKTPGQLYLTNFEVVLFRNFIERSARWIDAFSPGCPFSTHVPILALECPALLFSCLAISAKQMALVAIGSEAQTKDVEALQYYQRALRAFSALLMKAESARRDEILASSILLSNYEMLAVVGDHFGSHLRGIASLLRMWNVSGDSSGVEGAVYWTWYRSDTWAALLARRRMFLDERYWEPRAVDSFDHLSHAEIANRAMFLLGQCTSFCAGDIGLETSSPSSASIEERQMRMFKLQDALEQWKRMLPLSMTQFVAERANPGGPSDNEPQYQDSQDISSMLFIYPECAVGIQLYHACRILLGLSGPAWPSQREARGPTFESLATRRLISQSREQILLIASSGTSEAFGFVSTQCLYIAGLVTEGVYERRLTLELIERCQRETGRQTIGIADELRAVWGRDGYQSLKGDIQASERGTSGGIS
ncbi:hypothetical protein PV04_01295 [Phialophora macrospora]|uniref:Zn(2)-C6 fungal-type domain-containing protein n=1 Tax=Phialophora macrospora TaxID=1851006 RepID=A0A0D2EFP0_9EURO|nr:hypothetical protein PV04_01295 [Phialophora macrospora]